MMASGSTTFFFDFDIFSTPPVVKRLAGLGVLPAASRRRAPLGGQDPVAGFGRGRSRE